MEVKIRTFSGNGLLLFAGHRNQSDFFALKLKEGIPIFEFDNGKGKTEAVWGSAVNDGKWHKVSKPLTIQYS